MPADFREVSFGTCAGIVRTCLSNRFVLLLTLYLEHSPEGYNNNTPRRAHFGPLQESVARAHLITSCVQPSLVQTDLLGQLSPTGAHRENCGP